MGRRRYEGLMAHKGQTIYRVWRNGRPREEARCFWFAVSKAGAFSEAGNDAAAWADTFDVRCLPIEHRDGLDLDQVWSKIGRDPKRPYEHWLQVCRVAIRKAMNAGYDLRLAQPPRLEPIPSRADDGADDMPF